IRSAGEIRTEPVRKRKGKRLMIWACILFALVAFATINNNWIQVDPFTLPIQGLPQALDGLKIVHLSDIHLPKNAGTLPRLIQLVADQSPDLILITGDWVDRSADVLACGLLEMSEGLAAIAPTYAVTGNHEMENRNPAAWKAVLQKSGVHIIDNTYAVFEKQGQSLALMGLANGVPYAPERFTQIERIADLPRILLAHHPELWPTYSAQSYEIRPHLVLSGHAHGGQIRLPWIGGLLAPNQGFFPRYASGQYSADNGTHMIVSRGLGNSIFPLRVFNRPHLPVITLKSK
ncbi:TPA: metallophosphoesterase, partial [Pseudomonas aeruginosa]